MALHVLLSWLCSAPAAEGLDAVTSAPPEGLALARGALGDGVHLVAAAREFEPFTFRVDPDVLYAASTDEVYTALSELLPGNGLDMSLASLVATVGDAGVPVAGSEGTRVWRFEQQVEGVAVVGAGVVVVVEGGSVRRAEGALFLDRSPANLPRIGDDVAADRAIEAVHGGTVAKVLPYVLPVGPDLRHGWYVLVDTDVGAYEVAIDADTGEVLQLVSPQFGRDSGRFTPDDGFTPPPLPYGIIIGNGARIGNGAAATGVRLAGVSLVGGRLVRP